MQINDSLRLELVNPGHSEAIYKLVLANREYLREWLSWIDYMQSATFIDNFIAGSTQRYSAGTEYAFVIIENDTIVGRIGLYKIDKQNRSAEIGYWLANTFQGKGIVTAACERIVDFGFSSLQLNRIEIRCGTGNLKSQKIPERLGFTLEGIMRNGEWVNDRFVDLNIYSILEKEWH